VLLSLLLLVMATLWRVANYHAFPALLLQSEIKVRRKVTRPTHVAESVTEI
jgi:hypothetical protein